MKKTIGFRIQASLTVTAILAASLSVPLQSAHAASVTAVRATDFLDSLGVAIHLGQGQSAATVGAAMSYAGLRNARDMMNELSDVNGLLYLYNTYGIRTDAGVNGPNDANLTDQLNKARTLASAGALMAIEGPNEPGNFPVTFQGQTSSLSGTFMPVAKYQQSLYSQVKADSLLLNYPVYSASNLGAEPDNVGLQYIKIPSGAGTLMPDGTTYADYANSHNYVSGKNGQLFGQSLSDNVTWNAADPTVEIYNSLRQDFGVTWNKKFNGYTNTQLQALPRVTTETGWPSTGGPGNVITPQQQGKLFMNLYLSQFKRGIKNTFIYQIKDDSEANFGFIDVNNNYKPAADYLHNLTTILSDYGSMTPGQLGYSISGAPSTLHDLLLQKHDGTFELVIWNDRYSGTNNITVNLDAAATIARTYDPTVGTAPTGTYFGASAISLAMTDHPIVIEIPASSAATGSGTYVFGTGYSSAQGGNQWYYKQWNGSAYSDMTWNGSRWKGAQAWSQIGQNVLHPDTNAAALAWKAPKAGTVNISGNVRKQDMGGGDGVNVRIMKNGTQVWPSSGWQSIAFNDGTGFNPNVNVSVAQNDMIYFVVDKKGDNASDSTYWNPTIAYPLSYTFSNGFTASQGANQWFYKQWNGSAYADMSWNGSAWKGAQTWCQIVPNVLHPDTNAAALAWRAPQAGNINISGSVRKQDMGGGDGVNVKIMKNGTQIWPSSGWQSIAYNDGTGYSPSVNTTVAQNDMIYFVVDKKGDNASDSTYWNPTIAY
ncbi:hypothetical protein [Cohnella sp. 56]|uniref:hypothetical protein n=1 Tax=Cohnella sp. 56 TaxID=3113722 RepID=UPI0030E7E2C8